MLLSCAFMLQDKKALDSQGAGFLYLPWPRHSSSSWRSTLLGAQSHRPAFITGPRDMDPPNWHAMRLFVKVINCFGSYTLWIFQRVRGQVASEHYGPGGNRCRSPTVQGLHVRHGMLDDRRPSHGLLTGLLLRTLV